jgi:hypothetical protein
MSKKLITTPKGTALWTSLNKPDVRYKAEGVYEVKLAFDGDDPAVQALVARLEKMRDEKFDEVVAELTADGKAGLAKKITKAAVFEVEEDPETGAETGRLIKKFKMTASGISKKNNKPWSRKPKLFNARGVELKVAPNVGSGSVLKVSFDPFPYYTPKDKEVGLSARLEAAQIIDLVAFGERDAGGYGFGEEDGYDGVPEDDTNDSGFGDETDDGADDGDDDFA